MQGRFLPVFVQDTAFTSEMPDKDVIKFTAVASNTSSRHSTVLRIYPCFMTLCCIYLCMCLCLQVIRLSGYASDEKVAIARKYLEPQVSCQRLPLPCLLSRCLFPCCLSIPRRNHDRAGTTAKMLQKNFQADDKLENAQSKMRRKLESGLHLRFEPLPLTEPLCKTRVVSFAPTLTRDYLGEIMHQCHQRCLCAYVSMWCRQLLTQVCLQLLHTSLMRPWTA
jgi:hypothetical protein